MSTAVWTVLPVGAMVGIFAACVIAVVIGVRMLERVVRSGARAPRCVRAASGHSSRRRQ